MPEPGAVVGYATLIFLSVLTTIIVWHMLIGGINLRGLLSDKRTGEFSAERLQLLLVTLAGVVYYLFQALDSDLKEFPPVPDFLLLGAGGSNALYLLGKLYSHRR